MDAFSPKLDRRRRRQHTEEEDAAAPAATFLGTLRSELDDDGVLRPDFAALAAAVEHALASYQRFDLTKRALAEHLGTLRCHDADGREWTVGSTSLQWYRRDADGTWRLASPPTVSPDELDETWAGGEEAADAAFVAPELPAPPGAPADEDLGGATARSTSTGPGALLVAADDRTVPDAPAVPGAPESAAGSSEIPDGPSAQTPISLTGPPPPADKAASSGATGADPSAVGREPGHDGVLDGDGPLPELGDDPVIPVAPPAAGGWPERLRPPSDLFSDEMEHRAPARRADAGEATDAPLELAPRSGSSRADDELEDFLATIDLFADDADEDDANADDAPPASSPPPAAPPPHPDDPEDGGYGGGYGDL